jgi:hypothetical protein
MKIITSSRAVCESLRIAWMELSRYINIVNGQILEILQLIIEISREKIINILGVLDILGFSRETAWRPQQSVHNQLFCLSIDEICPTVSQNETI